MKYFLTGTDTGVGKTYTAALIAQAWAHVSKSAAYIKPMQTGADSDAVFIKKFINKPITVKTLYKFRHACSPHLAIRKAKSKKKFTTTDFKMQCKKEIKKYDNVLLEGAGGVFVPIYQNYRMIDLIKDLELPVILVARASLGTLNHTLLSYEALAGRGIRIKLLVINIINKNEKKYIIKDNIDTLHSLTNLPVFVLPHTMDLKKRRKTATEIIHYL
ncbi:MAG TPA: dethiobiotin synthase [Spirochaetota bacterium]|nr:dethiobiotin synthase [Spirochaetota bacterium]